MSGVKFDQEKADMSLLSSIAVLKVAQVMTFGKRKYSANNWRGGIAYSRLLAAALRHIFSYLGGESKDPETGISHLAHACCCLFMVLEFEETRPDLDDRYKPADWKETATKTNQAVLDTKAANKDLFVTPEEFAQAPADWKETASKNTQDILDLAALAALEAETRHFDVAATKQNLFTEAMNKVLGAHGETFKALAKHEAAGARQCYNCPNPVQCLQTECANGVKR